jgi:hypothetical protein
MEIRLEWLINKLVLVLILLTIERVVFAIIKKKYFSLSLNEGIMICLSK